MKVWYEWRIWHIRLSTWTHRSVGLSGWVHGHIGLWACQAEYVDTSACGHVRLSTWTHQVWAHQAGPSFTKVELTLVPMEHRRSPGLGLFQSWIAAGKKVILLQFLLLGILLNLWSSVCSSLLLLWTEAVEGPCIWQNLTFEELDFLLQTNLCLWWGWGVGVKRDWMMFYSVLHLDGKDVCLAFPDVSRYFKFHQRHHRDKVRGLLQLSRGEDGLGVTKLEGKMDK